MDGSYDFGSGFIALENSIKLIFGLRYKVTMFSVPLEGATNIFVVMKPSTRMRLHQNQHSTRSNIVLHITIVDQILQWVCVELLRMTSRKFGRLAYNFLDAIKRCQLLDYFRC